VTGQRARYLRRYITRDRDRRYLRHWVSAAHRQKIVDIARDWHQHLIHTEEPNL
jgi:hypothetical protein